MRTRSSPTFPCVCSFTADSIADLNKHIDEKGDGHHLLLSGALTVDYEVPASRVTESDERNGLRLRREDLIDIHVSFAQQRLLMEQLRLLRPEDLVEYEILGVKPLDFKASKLDHYRAVFELRKGLRRALKRVLNHRE